MKKPYSLRDTTINRTRTSLLVVNNVTSHVYAIVVFFVILSFLVILNSIFPNRVSAQSDAPPSPFPSLTQNLLLETATSSPTMQIETPVISELQKSLDETHATLSAGIPMKDTNSDYCITMPVIMYHHIQPMELADKLGHSSLTVDSNIFDQHIAYLKENNYTAISLEELVSALYARRNLPDKPVMITLDDGYDDNYTYAFMTAKKHRMVMNFMIPTGLVNTPGYVTWDHLREMRDNPYATIYNHTTTHAGLGVITKEQIIQETTGANNDLNTHLGITNKYMIYPYGSYSDIAIDTLKELGFIAGVSTDPGRNECLSTIMKLPRVRVGNDPIASYGF